MLDVFRTADHAGQIFIPHRINLNVWNDPPSCKRIPHESYEIIPIEKGSALNLIVLVRRTIDNHQSKQLTRDHEYGRGDSVKRGVYCRVNRTTQTNRGNDSVTIHTATIFIIILFNNIYFMYYFMYYITFIVAL